jgi:hypothetical protein
MHGSILQLVWRDLGNPSDMNGLLVEILAGDVIIMDDNCWASELPNSM